MLENTVIDPVIPVIDVAWPRRLMEIILIFVVAIVGNDARELGSPLREPMLILVFGGCNEGCAHSKNKQHMPDDRKTGSHCKSKQVQSDHASGVLLETKVRIWPGSRRTQPNRTIKGQ